MNRTEIVTVVDNESGVAFTFKNHEDKEAFFDAWDEYVLSSKNDNLLEILEKVKNDVSTSLSYNELKQKVINIIKEYI